MTAAFILAAFILLAVGFIAGALWERRKQRDAVEWHLMRAVRAELTANNLGAENTALRNHIDSHAISRRLLQKASDPWSVS